MNELRRQSNALSSLSEKVAGEEGTNHHEETFAIGISEPDFDDVGDIGMEAFIQFRELRRKRLGERYSPTPMTRRNEAMGKSKLHPHKDTGIKFPIGTPNDQPDRSPRKMPLQSNAGDWKTIERQGQRKGKK